VHYYEKQGLLKAPERQANGYRSYTVVDAGLMRLVRGAQALGFSLAETRND
jgi:DNA-binding transcriptional MerR regulator